MAFADVVTQNLNLTIQGSGALNEFVATPKSSAGAGVDVSSWDSFFLKYVDNGADLNSSYAQTTSPTLVSATAGKAIFNIALSTRSLNGRFELSGKPTSGDQRQVIAAGSFSLV